LDCVKLLIFLIIVAVVGLFMPIDFSGLIDYWIFHLSAVIFLFLLGLFRRALLDNLVLLRALHHAYFAKVAQEVGPHHVMLVDVGALDLGHLDEVVGQQAAIVLADSPDLRQTLIRVEEELLSHLLQFLALA